jgi:hypothetical protein
MIKTIKAAIIALCLLISASAFSQSDTGWLRYDAKWQGIKIDTTLPSPKYDTVDVVALVSDTLIEKMGIMATHTIRCKAIRRNDVWYGGEYSANVTYTINVPHDNWLIKEYLLPKKYIVWQSVIINNKTK